MVQSVFPFFLLQPRKDPSPTIAGPQEMIWSRAPYDCPSVTSEFMEGAVACQHPFIHALGVFPELNYRASQEKRK
jgi:hypothetical protein